MIHAVVFILGNITGVMLMSLLAINKEEDKLKAPTIKQVTPIIKASPQAKPYNLTKDADLAKLVNLLLDRAFVSSEKGETHYKSEHHRKRAALLIGNMLKQKYYIAFENKILFSYDGLSYELYTIEEVKEMLTYERKKLLTKGEI